LRGDQMTLTERCNLVLAFARVLFINGQSTDDMLAAAERLGKSLGLRAKMMARWGELELDAEDGDARLRCMAEVDPDGVEMDRVVSTMRAISDIESGQLAPTAATERIRAIAQDPPAPTWLFALAAASGAVSLAVLFGVEYLSAAVIICVSAAGGAILRRGLARCSSNAFLQPFSAALIAGVVGALATRYQLSSSLRLVAICPCMILVPGPHVLNGASDIINGRIHLGAARLVYASFVIVAISTGLLLGLALLGVSLPVDGAGRALPLWQDVIAAGIAVASYAIFFSMPLYMLPWPVAVGMLAQSLRWAALTRLGMSSAIGAMIACLVVGLILVPVARRSHMPFAAIGFASVVSMIPGVFLFRMASGLLQIADGSQPSLELIYKTTSDGITAMMVILAMSFGLIVPKTFVDLLAKRERSATP
jgi:uncharacterized membrane protein YjjP (DUF1212 family)